VTAEEDYVNQMLAPSMSFQEEMKKHGGDFDGEKCFIFFYYS
jgi:hypothetical protein